MRRVLGRGHGARGPAGLQLADHLAQPRLLGDRHTVSALGLLGDAIDATLGLLEVGEHQLGLDRLDVGKRIDAALGMDHVLVAVRAHDVHDRVGLADVGEKAVAEPLAFVGAGNQAGDVVEVDRVPHDLRSRHGLRNLNQALVEHGHDRHVGLDRRERVVSGLDAGLRERVEQRGLARVRQSDDADARAHVKLTTCLYGRARRPSAT